MSTANTCPKCGKRMKFSRVVAHSTFVEKRRDCRCGWSDKVFVREEILKIIDVVKRAKKPTAAEAIAAAAPKLAGHGGDRKSEANQDSVSTLNGKRDSNYLAARLKRDFPEIVDRDDK